ncbi:MAG: TetR/AcrR family transcriptional regulator [Planctomycetota bacterium]
MSKKPARIVRLDPEAWLDAGLDALVEHGLDGVRVEVLARRIGVTKGSFYHHFKDRPEFLKRMVERWRALQEGYLRSLAESPSARPVDRLDAVLTFIHHKDSRHDIALRCWARHDATVRRTVSRIDQARLDYLQGLFEALGFQGDQALLRSRLVYFYQVGEHHLAVRDPAEQRDRLLELRRALLGSGW